MNSIQQVPHRSWLPFHHNEACSEVSVLDFQRLVVGLFLQIYHLTGTILFTVKQTTHQCRDNMIKHTGGCHCGKVRFQAEADPWMVFQCNCMRCRRLHGTVAVFVAFDDSANVQISGETREYVTKGESGLPGHRTFAQYVARWYM